MMNKYLANKNRWNLCRKEYNNQLERIYFFLFQSALDRISKHAPWEPDLIELVDYFTSTRYKNDDFSNALDLLAYMRKPENHDRLFYECSDKNSPFYVLKDLNKEILNVKGSKEKFISRSEDTTIFDFRKLANDLFDSSKKSLKRDYWSEGRKKELREAMHEFAKELPILARFEKETKFK